MCMQVISIFQQVLLPYVEANFVVIYYTLSLPSEPSSLAIKTVIFHEMTQSYTVYLTQSVI